MLVGDGFTAPVPDHPDHGATPFARAGQRAGAVALFARSPTFPAATAAPRIAGRLVALCKTYPVMRVDQFRVLSPVQQTSLLVSMYVLNAVGDASDVDLNESQLRELTPVVRTAVFETLTMLRDDSPAAHNVKQRVLDAIPDGWEIPNTQPSGQSWNRFPEIGSRIALPK